MLNLSAARSKLQELNLISLIKRLGFVASLVLLQTVLLFGVVNADNPFTAIPNYTTPGTAGLLFRNDNNNHLRGSSSISPARATVTYTTDFTLPATDVDTAVCNTAGTISLVLPLTSGVQLGKPFNVINKNTGTCSLGPNTGETINGSTTPISLVGRWTNVCVQLVESGKWATCPGGSSGGGPLNTLPAQTGPYDAFGNDLTDIGTISAVVGALNSLVIGSPTGGNKGAGSVNATAIYVNGVAVTGGSIPINSAPSQTGTYDANNKGFTNLFSLFGHAIIQYTNNAANALLGMSINGTYNPVAYGADPMDTTDSMPAIQSASDSACANAPGFFGGHAGGSVVFPEGSFKAISSPLLIACDGTVNLRGQGQLATVLDSQGGSPNMGPGIVEVPTGFPPRIDPITATPLATGTGSDFSMNWGASASENQYFYNVSTIWEAGGTTINNPLNGLSANTFRMYFKPFPHASDGSGTVYGLSSINNQLTDIHPSAKFRAYWTYSSSGTSTITFCQATTGNPAPIGGAGPPKCITAGVTNSVVNYVEYNYGSNALHLAVGLPGGTATFVTSVASSGTLVNAENDDFLLGESATDPNQLMSGQIDSFEVAKVVRHTDTGTSTFTAPTAKFTSDSNTLALLNNQVVKNINVNGTTPYVFAIKSTLGSGWLVPFGFDNPSGGGVQSLEDIDIRSGFTINENSSTGLYVHNVNFESGYFGGYYGWNQAYNVRFNNVNFSSQNALYQLRQDSNTFGDFSNLSFARGIYLIIGTGGGNFSSIFEQIGAGTLVANTMLGHGDLFTVDNFNLLSTDAEEGGCAIPFQIGGGLSEFSLDHSAFQPAGCGSPGMQFGGPPPQRTTISNTGIFGNLQFDSFTNTTQPGLPSQPVQLNNDYTPDGSIGLNSTSVCTPYPSACQIVGANTQFSRLGIQVGPPQPLAFLENQAIGVSTVNVFKSSNAMSGDVYILVMSMASSTDPTPFTVPSGWTQDLGNCSSQSAGNEYVRTFHHSAVVSDPTSWSFVWTGTGQLHYIDTIVRGADQSNPVDQCFASNNSSGTAMSLTGGTSTNINDLVLVNPSFYQGTGVIASVGATPPSDLAPIVVRGSFGNNTWWYTPASLTIPTVNFVQSSSLPWAGLQIAIRSKTQSSTVLGSTSSERVLFQGMSGAKLQSLGITSGILQDGGLKHQRVTTGSLTAGSFTNVTLTWTTAFVDSNYTAFCSVVDSTSAAVGLSIDHVQSVNAGTVVVTVKNGAAGSLTGTLECGAMHDAS